MLEFEKDAYRCFRKVKGLVSCASSKMGMYLDKFHICSVFYSEKASQ